MILCWTCWIFTYVSHRCVPSWRQGWWIHDMSACPGLLCQQCRKDTPLWFLCVPQQCVTRFGGLVASGHCSPDRCRHGFWLAPSHWCTWEPDLLAIPWGTPPWAQSSCWSYRWSGRSFAGVPVVSDAQPLCVETYCVVIFALGGPGGSQFNVFYHFHKVEATQQDSVKLFLWLTQRSVLHSVAILHGLTLHYWNFIWIVYPR